MLGMDLRSDGDSRSGAKAMVCAACYGVAWNCVAAAKLRDAGYRQSNDVQAKRRHGPDKQGSGDALLAGQRQSSVCIATARLHNDGNGSGIDTLCKARAGLGSARTSDGKATIRPASMSYGIAWTDAHRRCNGSQSNAEQMHGKAQRREGNVRADGSDGSVMAQLRDAKVAEQRLSTAEQRAQGLGIDKLG